jgi:hypothetical protein
VWLYYRFPLTTGCGFFEIVEFVCQPRPCWVSDRQGEIG